MNLLVIKGLYSQEDSIYNSRLEPYEDVHSIKDLEEMLDHKVITRMYTVRKQKIFEYYKAATGEFIGFSTDLNKVKLTEIPHFKKMKGLKKLLRNYEPEEALKIYFQQQVDTEETKHS